MANGEIKLGDLLTDNQVAQISTLINEFKQEFNTQKSDSLVNQYMTGFANQQLPPPAPASAAPAPAIEQSQVNGSASGTGAAPSLLPVNGGATRPFENQTFLNETQLHITQSSNETVGNETNGIVVIKKAVNRTNRTDVTPAKSSSSDSMLQLQANGISGTAIYKNSLNTPNHIINR